MSSTKLVYVANFAECLDYSSISENTKVFEEKEFAIDYIFDYVMNRIFECNMLEDSSYGLFEQYPGFFFDVDEDIEDQKESLISLDFDKKEELIKKYFDFANDGTNIVFYSIKELPSRSFIEEAHLANAIGIDNCFIRNFELRTNEDNEDDFVLIFAEMVGENYEKYEFSIMFSQSQDAIYDAQNKRWEIKTDKECYYVSFSKITGI